MAQKIRVILLDDLANDGTTEADETVQFSLDGVDYEIDLTKDNAHKLRARLKEFTQAGRVVKRGAKRSRQPLTERAGNGATTNRHQGGKDPAVIRAWAVKEGLIPAGQRGRLAAKYREAYTAAQFHNYGPLNKLKDDLEAPGDTPALEESGEPAGDQASTPEDPREVKAREHYKPLTRRSPEMEDDKKWARRTAHGCQRTDKVEQMTLVERINAIAAGGSDRNLTILGMLAGILPLKTGKVSHLTGSAMRLQNLEMIQYAPDSEHGWKITEFGRYAHAWHHGAE
ncbi:histone-like nucleoid-structuring protein Lsr2 [Streptomyces sp. HMX87]|uniref:histone-like nucleoid-structuring protein Lsr2 n=1 Tax=Streptomyces sp. HMX87 TaxID=3390849 RepID=UPI003A8AC04D